MYYLKGPLHIVQGSQTQADLMAALEQGKSWPAASDLEKEFAGCIIKTCLRRYKQTMFLIIFFWCAQFGYLHFCYFSLVCM
jgi:hypothetical protein